MPPAALAHYARHNRAAQRAAGRLSNRRRAVPPSTGAGGLQDERARIGLGGPFPVLSRSQTVVGYTAVLSVVAGAGHAVTHQRQRTVMRRRRYAKTNSGGHAVE